MASAHQHMPEKCSSVEFRAFISTILCRNWIYVNRHMGAERAQRHTPEYAKRLIQMYNQKGEIDARCALLKVPDCPG